MTNGHDFLIKFIVIGSSSTGKSSLMQRFTNLKFKAGSVQHTVGIEFGTKIVKIQNNTVKLQIWDSAGQEAVTQSYWRNSAGCLLVYDITDRKSFNDLQHWLDDCLSLAASGVVVLLVGNKTDQEEYRQVSVDEGGGFAQKNNLMFLETSALTGDGVEEGFLKVARTILTKVENGMIDSRSIGTGITYGENALRNFPSFTDIEQKNACMC